MTALASEADAGVAFRKMRELQEQWKAVASAPRDTAEQLWTRFRAAGQAVREILQGKVEQFGLFQMRRMAGQDDGIVDALFGISRPVTGAYFWCPPMRGGRLDLRRLGFE